MYKLEKVFGVNILKCIRIHTTNNKSIIYDPVNLKLFYENFEDGGICTPIQQFDLSDNYNNIFPFYQSGVIRRLSINVSNTCNLACEYCYASKGNYGKIDSSLTTEEVIEYLFPLLNKYYIQSIMFFGGEPSLNIDTIIDTCLFINELSKLKKIKQVDNFGMVTNLCMSKRCIDKIILLSKQFNFNITVSIDGPKYIHDKNRIFPNGKGTYDKIRQNYFYLKSRGINVNIQCTYTIEHYNLGISPVNLLLYFKKEFDIRDIHLTFESVTKDSERYLAPSNYIKDLCELFSYCILKKYQGRNISISYLDRILSALLNREAIDLYCPALIRDIAMDFDGKLYPCFMFFSNNDFSFNYANIKNDQVQNNIQLGVKKDTEQCRNCWNKNLCFGCIAGDYIETDELNKRSKCTLMKILSIETMLRIVELSMDMPYESLGTNYRSDINNMIPIELV